MKAIRVLAAVSMLGLSSGTAWAADELAAPVEADVAGWSGFYIGGGLTLNHTNLDFSGGDFTAVVNGVDSGPDDRESEPGGHFLGGYLFQYNRLLFGVEGDAEFGETVDFEGPEVFSGGTDFCGTPPCARSGVIGSLDTQGHLRAIVGYQFTPDVMGFVAGGAAFGKATVRGAFAAVSSGGASSASQTTFDEESESMVGYTVGAGVQVKATQNIVLRGEVLYDGYGSLDMPFNTSSSVSVPGASASYSLDDGDSVEFNNTAARLSLIYKF